MTVSKNVVENNRFEVFYQLKEFQSLDRLIDESSGRILEQEKRLQKLKSMEDSRTSDLKDNESNLLSLKKKLSEKEILNQKLNRDLEQTTAAGLKMTTTSELSSFEKQRDRLNQDREALDLEMLQLMEEQESLEQTILDDKNFLSGIQKTYNEISLEVNEQNNKDKSLVKDFEMRQMLILEALPVHFRDTFSRIHKRMKGKRPITIAKGSICAECAFLLSRHLLSELDRGESLVTCPNCYRLLLPSSATS
ncbi:MAG: zinc ribbon domain-containing protein [Bacteriovoracaceae bacterium]